MTGETFVCVIEEPFFFGCETTVMKMHTLDTLKELGVEHHVVGVLGEQGLYLLGEAVEGAEQVKELSGTISVERVE